MSTLHPWWIVGFVDGEGCFSVDTIINQTMTSGVQVQANFTVTQGMKSLSVLESLRAFFGCGQVQFNPRADNRHMQHLAMYRVRKLEDLRQTIVPFFKAHPLRTAKANDFEMFAAVVEMMANKEHLTPEGLKVIRTLKGFMRNNLGSRVLDMESSETVRQAIE